LSASAWQVAPDAGKDPTLARNIATCRRWSFVPAGGR
jgi:hypothetical protein